MEGWIKLHRQLVHWEWYQDSVVKAVFIHLLLCACHSSKSIRGIELKPGMVLTSLYRLSGDLGLSAMQIRTALKKLEETGEITKQSTHKYSLITVNNFAQYQESSLIHSHFSNKVHSQKQQSDNTQATQYKNDNNVNNEKKEEVDVCYENLGKLRELYPDFDWDAYDEEDFLICKTGLYAGKGVVFLSRVQEDMLLDRLDFFTFEHYVSMLAKFIINNDACVKNHYLTILKWWREDGRLE